MAIVWLTRDMVYAFHLRQLAEHGGGAGVRNKGALDNALQRPRNEYDYEKPDIADLAAAYAFGIARNHPFIDGNKRTALVTSFTFLYLNGYTVATQQTENAGVILQLADGSLSEGDLAKWFRANLRKRG
jgi:death on curing protein